ncbi:acyl-CoA thioesterase [Halalkalibacter urbisdiaboli]|uniref:acyl-CoA thioesterase n=1 Tax=Halalkalibacter urbisdiaboli TaxID=1960589 RepID=UPI000B42F6F1|nr:acyl-CoA thioesterase [Halalkalibacter urbisdiaboli]
MKGKPASQSKTILTDLVLPPDTNHLGTMFGGNVMAYVDKVASIAAMRHSRRSVVTASSDSFDFISPIRTGEAICIEGIVTYTRRTSMEVFVKVEAEDLQTGERRLTATSYLTFVALNDEGKPITVVPVIPETDEEKWHYDQAEDRYHSRKKRREESLKHQEDK